MTRTKTGALIGLAVGTLVAALLGENPAVERLGEQMEWPLATWSDWEGKMKEDSSDRAIRKIAEDWIAGNRDLFDKWVAEAKAGAS